MNTIVISVTCAAIDADVPESAIGFPLTSIIIGGMAVMYAEVESELNDIEMRNLLMGATYEHPECAVVSVIDMGAEIPFLHCAMPHTRG